MTLRSANPARVDDGASHLRLAPVSGESHACRLESTDDRRERDTAAAMAALRRGNRKARNRNGMRRLLPPLFDPALRMLDAADADGNEQSPFDMEELRSGSLTAFLHLEGDPVPLIRCGLSNLYARSGRLDDARREIELLSAGGFAVLARDHTWLASIAFLGEACAVVGDRTRAAALYDLLMPYESEVVIVGHPASHYEGSVARILGLLATLLERWGDARAHFERGIVLDRQMGAPSFVARSQCEYARMLLAAASSADRPVDPDWPGSDAGLRLLSESIEAMTRLRMEGWLRQAVSPRHQVREEGSYREVPQPLLSSASEGGLAELDPPGNTTGGGNRGGRSPSTVPGAEAAFLDEGAYWTIRYGGVTTRVRRSKGLRYIALLLAHPGRDVHSLEIAGCAGGRHRGDEIETVLPDDACAQANGFGDSGEHLDEEAKAAYRRRLLELRQELEEARACHDAGRSDRLQEEIDFLTQEMARALGLRGRDRRAGSAAERARVNVTRTIALALDRIRAQHPALCDHFARTIRTGTFCSYAPDPRAPIEWKL